MNSQISDAAKPRRTVGSARGVSIEDPALRNPRVVRVTPSYGVTDRPYRYVYGGSDPRLRPCCPEIRD